MADKKKPYDVLIVEEYGEGKSKFYQVGVAFELDSQEGMSVLIPDGISVTGRLTILPRKDKTPAP